MVQPFFSLAIPTYNRAKDLRVTLSLCLEQKCRDFEIIVCDNASEDETAQVVKSFKTKRIKYFRNKTNIGAAKNFGKVISHASGKYIFTLGDDDFILFEDTLQKIKKILEKKPWGFIRLNLLEKKLNGKGLRKSFINTEEDFSIPPNSSGEAIFDFFNKTAASHLAGLVIKNRKNLSRNFIDCHDSPWVKPLYSIVKKEGGLFLSREYMVITWARTGAKLGISNYYDVPLNDRLVFEDYTDFVFKQIPKNKLAAFKKNFYSKFIILQPAIKLYSSNRNLIRFDRKLLKLEPSFKKNAFFWLMAVLAFLIPKFVWELVRFVQHGQKNSLDKIKNINIIKQRFNYLNESFS